MFTIEVRTFRDDKGNENYEVVERIGPYIHAVNLDTEDEVNKFKDDSKEYLALRGIRLVREVYIDYDAAFEITFIWAHKDYLTRYTSKYVILYYDTEEDDYFVDNNHGWGYDYTKTDAAKERLKKEGCEPIGVCDMYKDMKDYAWAE